jgi:hypothetical protein|tara:strand:+ start:356 stop:598 length:243 start_codon:yes stop_codon:yes gene_type:complete
MKAKGTFIYREENIHYEVDSKNGYWRQWFDCEDKKRFSLKDIFKFNESQMTDKLKCCDYHFNLSHETEPILWGMLNEMST